MAAQMLVTSPITTSKRAAGADGDVAATVEAVLRGLSHGVHGSSDTGRWASMGALWRDAAYAETWYARAADYWTDARAAPATVDGVLGGFAALDDPDARASRRTLAALGLRPDFYGADVAAGIGRVAKHVLLAGGARAVDVFERSAPLLGAAPAFVDAPGVSGGARVGGRGGDCRYVESSFERWIPARGRYDAIWAQWCVGHLTDDHFVRFLHRCRAGLAPGGFLVLKDNCLRGLAPPASSTDEAFVVDDDDRSVCRSRAYFRALFAVAGATVAIEAQQSTKAGDPEAFPDDIYPVLTFALRWPESPDPQPPAAAAAV